MLCRKKYVYVEVPSLSHVFRGEPFGLFAEEHLNYFTPYSLQTLMMKYGFGTIHLSVDYMSGYRVANGFPMIRAVFAKDFKGEAINSVSSVAEIMQSYMEYSIEELKKINGMVDNLGEYNLAIWGASYQLERLLAYTDLSKKNVVAIVDNSIEKQKLKFMIEGKEVAVSAPSILRMMPVDKVLISTWNNWRSIYRQIESMGLTADIIPLYE